MKETIFDRRKFTIIYIAALSVLAVLSMTLMLIFASQKVVIVSAKDAEELAKEKATNELTESVKSGKTLLLEVRSTHDNGIINISLPSHFKQDDVGISIRPDLKKTSLIFSGDVSEHFINNPPSGDFTGVGSVTIESSENMTVMSFITDDILYPDFNFTGHTLTASFLPIEREKPVVVIDARYGGEQPGTMAGQIAEKDINLRLANRIRLAGADRDYRIYLLRTSDETLSTEERLRIVNILDADYYVQLSLGSDVSDTKIFGMSAVYNSSYYRNELENVDFADALLKNAALFASDRAIGLESADEEDVILMALKIASARLNAGTITNPKEAELLLKDEYLDKIAQGILNALDGVVK